MKKEVISLTIAAALALGGCGNARTNESETPADEPIAAEDVQQTPAEDVQTPAEDTQTTVENEEPTTPSETLATETSRQDGERFETVIIMEGMEETVQYEHIRNDTIGFEMDYDYELLERHSEPDRECFISVWDDPGNPENYLEVKYRQEDADTVSASISEALSHEYELLIEPYVLDRAGSCIRIEASEVKGGGFMAPQLQTVYIIPAANGSIVATEHCAIEEAEGFGRRFSYMINTLTVIGRSEESALSDEQALSAIEQYCYSSNPDLEGIVSAGEYPVSWEISSSDANEIVVLFRSYTGALLRYYIDRTTGDTYVTEFVEGITPEEERTEESFNIWDYTA